MPDHPHEHIPSVVRELRDEVARLSKENDRLRAKIARDPVWFIPGKIVAHAGQCFKLRVDGDGPRIVQEKVAKVTCRSVSDELEAQAKEADDE